MSYNYRISGRGIVFHDNEILLNMFDNGLYYNIPGGGVEQGESIKEAVFREIQEESGLTVDVGEFLYTLECESPYEVINGKEIGQLSLVFRCNLVGSSEIQSPSIPDTNPDDSSITSHAVWVPMNKLDQKNLVPKINDNLIEFYKSGKFEPAYIEEKLLNEN